MREVFVAMLKADGQWMELPSMRETDFPPGLMSSYDLGGRQVILFGFLDGKPGVWRSRFGVDVEIGPGRLITSAGLDRLADLTEGPFERDIITATHRTIHLRWRLEG